ncbi:MAG: PAS domain-containing protein [Oscillospiraceae bacterium]|jgi:two-component system phosphate regulon sensor histidine kinase PhoR|nr:PAS domain-containing protein [Oscillospiraceae bacterium]
MRRRIFALAFLLAGAAALAASTLTAYAAYQNYFNVIKREAIAEISYIRTGVEQFGLDYINKIELVSNHRLSIVASDGTVLADTFERPADMDNHLNRPEIAAAITSGIGESIRYSDTIRAQTYYRATRLSDGSILRLASTTDSIYESFNDLIVPTACIAILMWICAGSIASRLTRRIVEPLNSLDLDHPENIQIYDELTPMLLRIKNQRREINRQMEELERQRNEFSAITNNMNEGFLVLDRGGSVLSYNKSALRLLDSQCADPFGKNILTLHRGEELRRVIQNALSDTGSIEAQPNKSILSMGGRDIQTLVSSVRNEGRVAGLVIVLMDVTEYHEREKLRREFTANVSHELKTPLTAIFGYAELLMNGMAKSEDTGAFAADIYREAQRLISLLNDLLYLSRLDEATEVQCVAADLLEICKGVAKRIQPAAIARGITVEVVGESAIIQGVPSMLDAIVFNLADNAIKYNRDKGSVSILVSREEGWARLSVSDTGIGIPNAEQERIFERFYRVDKSRNSGAPGTGLGLAIVKHGANMHGAMVNLKSDSKGTEVSLRFPMRADIASAKR